VSSRRLRPFAWRETLFLAFGAMIGWSWVMITGRWAGLGVLLAAVARVQR
jgi:hypothetical protein